MGGHVSIAIAGTLLAVLVWSVAWAAAENNESRRLLRDQEDFLRKVTNERNAAFREVRELQRLVRRLEEMVVREAHREPS